MEVNMDSHNRRTDDATIQVIAERINSMQSDVSDLRVTMKDSMEKMSSAVTKLVQIEERQFHMNQSYDRLSILFEKWVDKSERLEARIDALEKEQPLTKQVVKWVLAAVWAVVGAAGLFISKTLGFVG
jgi:DNA repair ATPase RecN